MVIRELCGRRTRNGVKLDDQDDYIDRGGRLVKVVAGGVVDDVDDGGGNPLEGPSEKRIRREIANSNERRRMQSINAGFSSLRSILPHHEGEKLSKAAILQQTAEYIYSLEQEKTRLLSQNCQLKRLLGQTQQESDETDSGPAPKRRLMDTGQKLLFEDEGDELVEIQNKYERERRTRMVLEEKVRTLEAAATGVSRRINQNQQHQYERFTLDDRVEIIEGVEGFGQTILTPGAKKQGQQSMDTIILQTGDRLPSIIQCAMKDGNKVEVEHLPRLSEFSQDGTGALEIASVQDPETGATRQYILTQMCDTTSKQNLETIVEAIRHLEGDHLFSEESGPHQVVKEEVVESTISLNEDSTMMEVTLPNLSSASILPSITSIPQISSISGPGTVPVSFTFSTAGQLSGLPLLPQVPVSLAQLDSFTTKLSGVSSIQALDLGKLPAVGSISSNKHFSSPTIMAADPLELTNIGPPQTSPVNLELAGGSLTPTSDIAAEQDHMSNSPPQSSPVNLAQSQQMEQEH